METLAWHFSQTGFDQRSPRTDTKIKVCLLVLSARVRSCWDSNPGCTVVVLLGLACKSVYREGHYPHLCFCVLI